VIEQLMCWSRKRRWASKRYT